MDTVRDNSEDWKRVLRSNLIIGQIGSPQEKIPALTQIGYYYQCYAPVSLYKYYSDKPRNLEMVKANQMWYSAPSGFNDAFDCDISINEDEVFKSVLQAFPDARGIRKGSPKWKALSDILHKELQKIRSAFEGLKNSMGISCLSESNDSLLMWAHYANNHRGICIEYEMPEIVQQLNYTPVPVIYTDKRASFYPRNLENLGCDTIALFNESITTKSPEWAYEREWRIIRDDSACGDKWDKEKKGALLDMIHPSSITMGCAAEQAFEDDVKKYCKANRVNLYKMKKDPHRYCLNREVIVTFDP